MDIPLPNEIIVNILEYLSHYDLCNFSLVSRRMSNVASTPTLWSKTWISRPLIAERGLSELIQSERYSLVERVDLYQQRISEQKLIKILEQTLLMKGLKKIVLYDHVLTNISADLLAEAFIRLEEVVIGGTFLKRDQLTRILQASLGSTSLKSLDLSNLSKISEDMWENTGHLPVGVTVESVNRELSNVSDDLLTKSLTKLEKVSLKCNKLGLIQWNSIIENTPGSKLQDLDLSFNSEIIDIPGITLARAVASLKKINLAYITLTDEQLLSIFNLIKTSQTLEDINIGNIKLQDIPKEMLRVLCKLKVVNIEGTNLTNSQVFEILSGMANQDSQIQKLNISRNSLQEIPHQLLADAIRPLTHLNISDTSLTTDQCSALFSSLPDSKLEYLDISGIPLSSVPTNILAKGVCSLREVDLSTSQTTSQQVIAILTNSKNSKTLKKVMGLLSRNIPKHLEQTATYLGMVTPFGNRSLRAHQQEKTLTLLRTNVEPAVPWLAGIQAPGSGNIPPPPPPPPGVFGNIPPPPPPPPPYQ